MSELLSTIPDAYARLQGRGRLIPLVIAAAIVLYFMKKKTGSRSSLLLLVLSAPAAVSAAAVKLVRAAFCNAKERGKIAGAAAVLLAVTVLILSGSCIWSVYYLSPHEVLAAEEETEQKVFEAILSEDAGAKVVTTPEMTPYFLAYSPAFSMLTPAKDPAIYGPFTEDAQNLYEIMSDAHPDFERVHRLLHGQGNFFIVIDKNRQWPEHAYERGILLFDTIDHYDIYLHPGGADD